MLREYRRRPEGLPDLLNLAALVAEGLLLGKDGSLTAGWWYAGPDLEAASAEELAVLSSQVNAALLRLGNGWMLEANAIRRPAGGYAPRGAFPDPVTALLDEERRQQYAAGQGTFESVFALTLLDDPTPRHLERLRPELAGDPSLLIAVAITLPSLRALVATDAQGLVQLLFERELDRLEDASPQQARDVLP